MTCTTILTVEPVHTGPTAGICGGAVLAAPGVADNGGPHECPPQPFWTGVAMAPCFTSFPTRWTYSPHRFMQVPTNADFRSLSDSHVFGTVLHERTLKHRAIFARNRTNSHISLRFHVLNWIFLKEFAPESGNYTGLLCGLFAKRSFPPFTTGMARNRLCKRLRLS